MPSDRSRPRAPLSSTPPRWCSRRSSHSPIRASRSPVRLERLQQLFTVEQLPQSGQVHRLALQRERPCRPQRPLVGRIAEHARIGAVVLGLEQQVGHLPRPRVEQIGRQLPSSVHTWPPWARTVVVERWAALRVDDDDGCWPAAASTSSCRRMSSCPEPGPPKRRRGRPARGGSDARRRRRFVADTDAIATMGDAASSAAPSNPARPTDAQPSDELGDLVDMDMAAYIRPPMTARSASLARSTRAASMRTRTVKTGPFPEASRR